MSRYGVFSGSYLPVFVLNMGKYGPEKLRIWTFFAQCLAKTKRIILNIVSLICKSNSFSLVINYESP